MRKVLWLLLLLGGIGCASSVPPASSPGHGEQVLGRNLKAQPQVLAIVAGTPITMADLERAMENQGGAARFPTRERREVLLNELIQHRVMLFRALDEGYDQREEVVEAFERILVNLYRREHLEESEGLEDAASLEAIERYYRDNTERFMRPKRSRLALIQVDKDRRHGDESRERALETIEQARQEAMNLDEKTKGFGRLAKQFSTDAASKYVGGIVGWIYPHRISSYQWPSEALAAGLDLQEAGDLSEIQEGEKAFYLWKLVKSEAAEPVALDRVRDGIAGILRKDQRSNRKKAFVKELLESEEVWVEYDRLDRLPELTTPVDDPKAAPPPLPGG